MLTMESIFRRLINAGIGVASKTTRFAEDMISDLVDKGKISESEGKSFLEKFEREGEEQRQVFEREMNEYIQKAVIKMDLPSREDFKRLEDRVRLLENSQPGATQVTDLRP